MEQKEILDIIRQVVSKRKSKWSSSQLAAYKGGKKSDYPEYYPTYGLCVEMAECNRYHAEKGVFPNKLFSSKSPYQTKAELEYIKDNYKQITLPVADDFIKTISRAFNEGNYSITYQEDDTAFAKQTLREYLETGIYTYGSLENFIKSLLPFFKTVDPNGVITVKPYLPVIQNSDGEEVISSTELNEPQPYYYDVAKVVAFKEEEYCLIDVTAYSKKAPTIYLYELYDTEFIYTIQVDSTKDINKEAAIKVEVYYKHEWGQLPVTKIKGIPRLIDGEIIWQSSFSFVTDILDIVALDNSTLTIAKHKSAYPIRVYEGRPCTFEYKDKENNVSSCIEGQVYDSVLGKNINCPNCHGIGQVDRFSPLHDFITKPDLKLEGGTSGTKVPFQYVAPDTKILEFLENSIAKNEERARKILHIQNSNAVIKGTENLTATGMALGDKSTSAFIKPISDEMFDLWQFLIDAIGWMRYKSAYKSPTLTRPKSFDFNTEYDYILEISTAIASGLPPVMVRAIMIRYMKSHFYSDSNTSKAFAVVITADSLIGLSQEDIAIQQGKGVIANWQVILHNSAITIINSLVGENKDYFNQDLNVQVDQLVAKAKAIAIENQPKTNTQTTIASVLE